MVLQSFLMWILAAVIIYIIIKIFAWPIKLFIRLVFNGLAGMILLNLYNYFLGGVFHFILPINIVTSLIVGFLGIPGFILVVFLQYFVGI